MTEFEIGC